MRFDFVDLRLFVHLANTKNLTRAAERSHMSLSAASARIKNLEDNLGSKLIFRHNLGVTLTPQGETFLHHARHILQQCDELTSDMQEYSLGMKGHLRLYANSNASTAFLPDVLHRFLQKNPRISIELQERSSAEIIEAITSGVTDIGVVSSGLHTGNLQVLHYFPDPIVLVVSPTHPLAARESMSMEEALDQDFIALPGTRHIDSFLVPDASGNSQRLRIRVEVGNYETVCRMVEANIGIGVMPASAAVRHARASTIRIITLTNEWADSELLICSRNFEQLPKFARELVDMMTADARYAGKRVAGLAS